MKQTINISQTEIREVPAKSEIQAVFNMSHAVNANLMSDEAPITDPECGNQRGLLKGTCDLGLVARTLGYSWPHFLRKLKGDGVLETNNMPGQDQIAEGHFIMADCGRNGDVCLSARVTGKGQVYLARQYPPVSLAVNRAQRVNHGRPE